MVTAAIWPALDYSRVPYRFYHDAEIYAREQQRIFEGPTWSFLGLDAEIPKPGDFRATWVGETPVVFNRDATGAVRAFVNRCAHRGALVRRELSGNANEHICIYHQWCYGLEGGLTAIPFHPAGPGRARRRLRDGRARSALVEGPGGLRGAFRHSFRRRRAAQRLFGPRSWPSCAASSTGRSGCLATIASASAPIGSSTPKTPGTLPCQPVARISRHLRARPLDPGRRGEDGRPPPAQYHLGRGRQRHRRIRPRGLCRRPGAQRLPVVERAGDGRLPSRARRHAQPGGHLGDFPFFRSSCRFRTAWRSARSGRAGSTSSRCSRR